MRGRLQVARQLDARPDGVLSRRRRRRRRQVDGRPCGAGVAGCHRSPSTRLGDRSARPPRRRLAPIGDVDRNDSGRNAATSSIGRSTSAPPAAGRQEPQRAPTSSARRLGARRRPGRRSRGSNRNSARWKPGGSSAAIVPAATRAPAKPISAFGSAMLTSPDRGERREHAAGRRVGQDRQERHAAHRAGARARPSSWPAASGRACPPASARRPTRSTTMSGIRVASASSAARVTFSPTTAPIEPPMNPKSMTQIATARALDRCRCPTPPRRASRSRPARRRGGPGRASGRRSRAGRPTGGRRPAPRTMPWSSELLEPRWRPTAGSGGRRSGRPAVAFSSCLLNSIVSQDGHLVHRSGG